MSKRTAFWIFLIGTISSAVLFLYLTYDTHKQIDVLTHTDRLSEEVIAGKKVWEKYNCNDCHTILGFGGYYAPDMTKVYKRIGAERISAVIKHPDMAFANSWRKMPVQNLSDDEVTKVTAFLKWVGEIDNNDWPPQDSAKKISRSALKLSGGAGISIGAALFKEKGCIACHSVAGIGGGSAPALDEVSHRHNLETLKKLIRNPKSINPKAVMPPQTELTESELNSIANFLTTLE